MHSRRKLIPISRGVNYPYPYPYPYPYFYFYPYPYFYFFAFFLFFGFLTAFGNNGLNCFVASSLSIWAAAIAKVRLSHFAESGFGSTPLRRKKTKQAPNAVRLLPSKNG